MQILGVIGDIADFAIGFDPVNSLAVFGPEGIVIRQGLTIHRCIALIGHQCTANDLCSGLECLVLAHYLSSGIDSIRGHSVVTRHTNNAPRV